MDQPDQDYHNFSTSSSTSATTHKLPTVSGTQAIRGVIQNTRPISTSLPLLDATLGRKSTTSSFVLPSDAGGLQRGVVTEVFGPPGVGKTTFALQVAVNAIYARNGPGSSGGGSGDGSRVTWIDTSSQLVPARLRKLAEACYPPSARDLPSSSPAQAQAQAQAQAPSDLLLGDKFHYRHVASLPKLLTLFLHRTPNFPPPNTTVVVLNDVSSLILSSLPRSTGSTVGSTPHKSSSAVRDDALAKRALSRRFQVLSSFASGLQRFAAANNVAVLVTSKATVNLRPNQKAVLRPALTSQQWDNYLSTRIALYRDFWPEDGGAPTTQKGVDHEYQGPTEFERRSLRFAKVIRLGGKLVSGPEVGFVIEEGGLREVRLNSEETDKSILPLATQPLPALEDVLEPSMNHDKLDLTSELKNDDSTSKANNVDDAHSEASHATKRKAIEIADSEEEDEAFDISDDNESSKLPNSSKRNDFRPSSQILHASQDEQQQIPSESTEMRQPIAAGADGYRSSPDLPSNATRDINGEEMLLDAYEAQVPLFSQAAAEMSEPLTPSDDGRDLS